MKSYLRGALGLSLASALFFAGQSQTALAEPIHLNSGPQEIALLGPDRSPRAPQRAIEAPVDTSTEVRRREVRQERETVVAPPPVVEEFVYEKRVCRPLVYVPYKIDKRGAGTDIQDTYLFEDGRIRMWTSDSRYYENSLGSMGADREFLHPTFCDRLGVWTNGDIAGHSPEHVVSTLVQRLEEVTCGTFTEPRLEHAAGIPVMASTGYDLFGRHYYEVYSWERFGNTYAVATRIPYNARYNVARNANLAYMISHTHPSSWTE